MNYSNLIDKLFFNDNTNPVSIISKILLNIYEWKSPKNNKKAWKETFSHACNALQNVLKYINRKENISLSIVIDRLVDHHASSIKKDMRAKEVRSKYNKKVKEINIHKANNWLFKQAFENEVKDIDIDIDNLAIYFSLKRESTITSKVNLKLNKEFKNWVPGESRKHESVWLFDETFTTNI